MKKIKKISDVVNGHLCTGCGVCAYLAPKTLQMIDFVDLGKRPVPINNDNLLSTETLECCPGAKIERLPKKTDCIEELQTQWGNVFEVWEGYASDTEIRKTGSSGGIITALSQFCLEIKEMDSVLNTISDTDAPHLNKTVKSTNKAQLIEAAGSRYSPSSPCEHLQEIENSKKTCVFVGKPCDVYAVQKARIKRPALDEKLGLTLSFFCAGVPSTNGTIKLMNKMGLTSIKNIISLRYRGNGWPGKWTLKYKEKDQLIQKQMTYAESWGELQKDRQWRCYICPDHVGEFADISVGDPWYREIKEGEDGRSLIIVRTRLGQKILKEAQEQGFVVLEKCDPTILPLSQPNLIQAKNVLWGRLLALKISGASVPNFSGYSLLELWLQKLPIKEKVKSLLGTLKRVYVKGLLFKQTKSHPFNK